ncbi:MAG: dephospho-CoA kinase [Paludibacteraceae bacterium]|nr:dephospho-CoA kinase [Paludibacteraceae bacterium]
MIIGLTGGIGSGKSTIAKQLREMGYAVYDTDSEAKRLIVEDTHVREQMEQVFGKEVYADGIYQTALVAQRVFADQSLLAQLNAIVHPAVKADILRWAQALHNSTQFYTTLHNSTPCFVECAILYQAGFDALCDKVMAVTAPEEVRLARAVARDHSTIDKVRARMRVQKVEEYIQRADLVINNDGKTSIPTLCEEIIRYLSR